MDQVPKRKFERIPIANKMLDNLRGNIQENETSSNLHLTKAEFMEKMKLEPDGQALLDLLQMGEHKIVERMGLMHGYADGKGNIFFDIPRWNNLVEHLRIVNSV